ncbi:MAG: hypothetical protein MZV63_65605 [Marinilabiliales bacterium]|nr:hypothetical protein [Marinilabiliales bacterium]
MTWVLSRYHIRRPPLSGPGARGSRSRPGRPASTVISPSATSRSPTGRRPRPLGDELLDGHRPRQETAGQGRRRSSTSRYAVDKRALDDPFASLPVPAARDVRGRASASRSGHHRLEPPRQQRGLRPVGARRRSRRTSCSEPPADRTSRFPTGPKPSTETRSCPSPSGSRSEDRRGRCSSTRSSTRPPAQS